MIQYAGATYQYTAGGTLQQKTDASGATLPDGKVISYVIDAQGRRVGKKVNGVLVKGWQWEGQLRVTAELDGSGAVLRTFAYAGSRNAPELMSQTGQQYRLLKDHLGTVRLVANTTTGQVLQRRLLDEFGQVLTDTAMGAHPFGFAGGV